MKRVMAGLLATLLAVPGCAVRMPVGRWSRTRGVHIAGVVLPVRQKASELSRDAEAWRRYLEGLPIGSQIKTRTLGGESLKAVYMGVQADRVVLQPRTRIPEPLRQIPIADLASLELDNGPSLGKTIAISAGVAAATFLGILLILVATVDD